MNPPPQCLLRTDAAAPFQPPQCGPQPCAFNGEALRCPLPLNGTFKREVMLSNRSCGKYGRMCRENIGVCKMRRRTCVKRNAKFFKQVELRAKQVKPDPDAPCEDPFMEGARRQLMPP